MKNEMKPSDDGRIRTLLRESCPTPSLPANFQVAVWRRIEREEVLAAQAEPAFAWLERWIERLLLPRFAIMSLALLLFTGGLTGVVNSAGSAKHLAQERYLSIVAPNTIR